MSQSRLVKKEEVAEGTMAFWFDKPKGFTFKAGQHAMFTLKSPKYTDDQGDSRTLSFASSPNDEELMVATRMRDTAFKKSLKELDVGVKVEVGSPTGFFTLNEEDSRSQVFLAGGIGVTPFRSMVKWACEEKLKQRIFLFYSNRTPELTAFLDDFEGWEKDNPSFKFIATVTQIDSKSWEGERGRVDKAMLEKYVEDLGESVYYIAGPHGFMVGMYEMLESLGVERGNIHTEEFTGY